MAEKVVKSSDIIEDDVFRPTRESAEKTLPVLTQMQKVFEDFLKMTKENVRTNPLGSKDEIDRLNQSLEQSKEIAAAKLKIDREVAKIQAANAAAYNAETQALNENKIELEKARMARAELNKEARQAAILAKAEEGSLEQLRVKLSQATKALDQMSAATLKTQRGLAQIELVGNLNKQISEVEQASGRFQRNVGNYKSGYDGLAQSINQLTREAPNAAISMQTFFMAISNNLPMFADEINKIKKANIELAATGQPTVSVLGRIASAFFSWQTLISAGITLLTVYGAKLFNYITGTEDAAKAQDDFNKSLEEANKQYETLAERAEAARLKAAVAMGNISQGEADSLNNLRKYMKERDELTKKETEAVLKINKGEVDITEEQQKQIDEIRNLYNTARIHLREEYQSKEAEDLKRHQDDMEKRYRDHQKKLRDDAEKARKAEFDRQSKLFDDEFQAMQEQQEREVQSEYYYKNEALEQKLALEEADFEATKLYNEWLLQAQDDFNKSELDKQKKAAQELKQAEQVAANELNSILQKYYNRREMMLDRTIDNSKRRQDELRQLAALGVQDAKDSLAAEQKVQAEAEQKKLELDRKKQRAELGTAAFKAYAGHVENGDKNAVQSTIKDIVTLSAFVQSLPAFYEGTENTGSGGGLDGKGGFLSVLHPNERVMTAEQNNIVGSLTNAELASLAGMYNAGLVAPAATVKASLAAHDVVSELREVKRAIKNIEIPHQQVYYDETTKALINVVETRNKVIRTHYKSGSIWG